MDDDNLADLERIRPAGARAKVALLMSYAPDAGSREVPDPYYGGADGFETVLDLVEAAADGFIARVVAELSSFGALKTAFARGGLAAAPPGVRRYEAHALPRRTIRRGPYLDKIARLLA